MHKSRASRQSRELIGFIAVLLAVLLGFALYSEPGKAGVFGDFVRTICLALWGPVVYALPPLPLLVGYIILMDREHRSPPIRIVHAVLAFCIASALWHILNYSLNDTRTVLQLIRRSHSTLDPAAPLAASPSFELFMQASLKPELYFAHKSVAPGGLIGGVTATSLETLMGFSGAVAVLILMLIVELVILFNFSVSYFVERLRERRREAGIGTVRDLVDQRLERSRERFERLAEGGTDEEEEESSASEVPAAEISLALWNARFYETWQELEPAEADGDFVHEPSETVEGGTHEEVVQSPPAMPLSEQKSKVSRPWFSEFFQEIPERMSERNAEHLHVREEAISVSGGLDAIVIETFQDEGDEARMSTSASTEESPSGDSSSEDSPAAEAAETESPSEAHDVPAARRQTTEDEHSESPEPSGERAPAERIPSPAPPAKEAVSAKSADDPSQPSPMARESISEEGEAERPYVLPPLSLLREESGSARSGSRERVQGMAARLMETLKSFGVEAKLEHVTTGPTITRFELSPGRGVKVSRIVNLSDDIALSLAATGVRIEAPIPGKSAIGIEIPNDEKRTVDLRPLLESRAWRAADDHLVVPLGRDIPGAPIICDLKRMPHLLIAGATGSGKSICINTILISILYRSAPQDVRLLLIDPKVVELAVYNDIPHLLAPVVTDPKKAANTLNWAVEEMTRRYALFAQFGVRNAEAYNRLIVERREAIRRASSAGEEEVLLRYQDEDERRRKRAEAQNMNVRESSIFPADEELPHILLVIDELSDLMQTSPKEVEDAIARLTAMARAAGIHLIIATQRPSVDVITGVIKANIPSRVAFAVSSQIDSRTILDQAGAEKLQGKGDMLYNPLDRSKPLRGQGAFVSSEEVERVLDFIRDQKHETTDPAIAAEIMTSGPADLDLSGDKDRDELYPDAMEVLLDVGYASVSILQRRLNVGYPRAAALIDALEQDGLVGPFQGSKPRDILVDRAGWEAIKAGR